VEAEKTREQAKGNAALPLQKHENNLLMKAMLQLSYFV
jgi:hypothetical protein